MTGDDKLPKAAHGRVEQNPADDGGEGGFLRRWSRRKGSQVKKVPGEAASEPQTAVIEAAEEMPLELPPEAPVRGRMITSAPGDAAREITSAEEQGDIDEADLPDVEELEADSDFTPFLKKGVSEQLQRRALRKLWLSDPVLANVDGLLDYGDDFTDAALVVENLKTVYTVGRGMVPAPEEPAPEELVADEEAEAGAGLEADAETDAESEGATAENEAELEPETGEAGAHEAEVQEIEAPEAENPEIEPLSVASVEVGAIPEHSDSGAKSDAERRSAALSPLADPTPGTSKPRGH